LGRRSRQRARPEAPEQAPHSARVPAAGARPARRSAEERNADLRAQLRPLEAGERPWPLAAAAVAAALLGVANIVLAVAGVEVRGNENQARSGAILLGGLLLAAAWGMWTQRYWAVLGFQAILGITIAYAALSVLVASNVWAVVLCVGIIVPASYLFWKLIRVMARIQTPRRSPRAS
jgi:hypothetical protein